MMNLDEAIQHCEEKAKELRTEAEQLRDIGDAIINSKQPYNEPVKNCRECAEEHEQLAEWLMELKKLREENVNQFLNSKDIILALIEENKALRKQRPQGDLISRSEAEELGATCLARRNENGQLEAIISLDNAPTVDLWQLRQEATENALKKAEVLYGRPQGEWKVNKYGEHFCPKCGHYALYDEEQDNDYYEVQSNFCPECGADMRGKK